MVSRIESRENKTIKAIKKLKRKSCRLEERRFIAEGKKIVLEAFLYVPSDVSMVVVTDSFLEKEPEFLEKAQTVCEKIYIVSESIFTDISDTDTPQGVMAVIEMNNCEFSPKDDTKTIVILDGVSEPGNMGTVIRTAEALGFDGIYITKGSADIYSPKTVRSTMGSVFRMKFKNNCVIEDINALKDNGFSVVATTPDCDIYLENFKTPSKVAVVIGNEAHGVCEEVLNVADFKVKIRMDGLAESLNAAVAAGIAMHWIKNH